MNQDPLVQMKLDFIADASEKVEKLSQSLAAFDPDNQVAGASVDLLFRTAHSLKGTAGMFELGRVSGIAAAIENVLELVRSGTLMMDSRVAGLLLDAFDEISVLFANARGQGTEDHAAEIIVKIERFVSSISGAGRTGESDVVQPRWVPTLGPRQITTDRVASQLSRQEGAALRKHIEEGHRIFLIEFPDGESGLHGDEVILRRMHALGEIVAVLSPSGAPGAVDTVDAATDLATADDAAGPEAASPQMALVFALKRSEQDFRDIVGDSKATVSELLPQTGEAGAADLPATSDDGGEGPEPGDRPDPKVPEARLDVKVGIDVLDSIMNTISELYSIRVGLNGVADRLPRTNETRRLRDDLLKLSLLINKRVSALEQTITGVRLVPMAMLFERYRGEVRRLAKSLGKSVGLAFEGEATLVDRALLERLYDPCYKKRNRPWHRDGRREDGDGQRFTGYGAGQGGAGIESH
jgi:two-component system chemotaxis sensor kinase CheA